KQDKRVRHRKRIGLDAAGIVVFVGRLVEQKNVNGLLLAWKVACTNLPDGWKLVLVGDGSMREQLEALSKAEGLTTSIIFAGQQSNIAEWMAASDILVVPSYWEGLSNTMLEAMSTGLAVVSTRVSGSTETLEKTGAGLVVDIGNMEQFANAVLRLASDFTLRDEMGKIGRAVIEKNYSIETVADRHERLYHSLVS
ncbi:MAG: glycosyltransferase family 4 protein, partial [Gammaproteobacteria bacterium]|nr:glycosyltransferase family 4 protein [Gammaproteobacteria bacterium]